MENIISVDLGGTWIRAAVVSPDGVAGPVVRRPAGRHRPGEEIYADLLAVIDKTGAEGCDGIVVGVPTVPNDDGGFLFPGSLPTMAGFNLVERLRSWRKVPVRLYNDAECFTAGEWRMGAGKGMTNLCGLTLGTGLGMGMIINAAPYIGSRGCAGEIWKIPCGTGMLEDEICGDALVTNYESIAKVRLAGEKIADLARQGDSAAVGVFRRFGEYLGRVISLVINTLDPEAVVVGGSVAQSFSLFRRSMEETVLANTIAGEQVRIMESALGESAAIFGAAYLFWSYSND